MQPLLFKAKTVSNRPDSAAAKGILERTLCGETAGKAEVSGMRDADDEVSYVVPKGL